MTERGSGISPAALRVLRKGGSLLSVYYALMSEYRSELLLWGVALVLPLIMMGLWLEAGEAGATPLTTVETARYFLAAFAVRQFLAVWVIYEFEYNLVTGRLSPLLLQPIDPVWRFVSMHFAEWGARIPFALVVAAVAAAAVPEAITGNEQTPGGWRPEAWRWAAGAGLAGLAFLTRFVLQYTVAMLGFWQERVHALDLVVELPFLFLSGVLFPLEVLFQSEHAVMRAVGEVAMATPFPYMLWLPAQVFAGAEFTANEIGRGFAVLAAWLVGVGLLNRLLWRRGLRRYSAMGA